MSVESPTQQLEERIRLDLPSLDDEQMRELADIIEQLVIAFEPERTYASGSLAAHQRGIPRTHELDLHIERCEEIDVGFASLRRVAFTLTPYAFRFRIS